MCANSSLPYLNRDGIDLNLPSSWLFGKQINFSLSKSLRQTPFSITIENGPKLNFRDDGEEECLQIPEDKCTCTFCSVGILRHNDKWESQLACQVLPGISRHHTSWFSSFSRDHGIACLSPLVRGAQPPPVFVLQHHKTRMTEHQRRFDGRIC